MRLLWRALLIAVLPVWVLSAGVCIACVAIVEFLDKQMEES